MVDHIRKLGCCNEARIIMAHQTFLELSESEGLRSLVCRYNSKIDIIYIIDESEGASDVYVPVHSSFTLTPSWIRTTLEELSTSEPKNIVLVIREGDSTSVRYKLTAALEQSNVDSRKYPKVNTIVNDELCIKKKKLQEEPECSQKA